MAYISHFEKATPVFELGHFSKEKGPVIVMLTQYDGI